jgi:hypothetical protein
VLSWVPSFSDSDMTTFFTFKTFRLHGDPHGVYQYLLDYVRKTWPDAVGLCRRDGVTDVYVKGNRVRHCEVLEIYKEEGDYLLPKAAKEEAPLLSVKATPISVDITARTQEAALLLDSIQAHPLWR